ncbi:general secretion pathway protein GspB [Rhodoferax sp.]|uniref:general secretion pathway protein GspB n=1 Tax=Rhodoferax sp. TaxID=50421 RepID=UPI00260D0766|nr:general secretion pathway protein GspB [Rhodoferax sp.]MDD5479357.1 general secretion pathway protein GspB [Rhodoferax sp.]
MSYILDALQRAQAQRARASVPGLASQPLPGISAAPLVTAPRAPGWLVLGVALMAVAAGLGWWGWRSLAATNVPAHMDTVATAPTVAASTATTPAAANPQPRPAAAPAPAVAEPAPAPQPSATVKAPKPTPAPTAKATALAPTPAAASAPTAKTKAETTAKPTTKAKPTNQTADKTAGTAADASPKAAAPAAVPALAALPEQVRRQIPPLTITGSVYSATPSQRLLLVNNLVLPQGSPVAQGLTLEEIRPNASVFNYQGTRFSVPH